MKEFPASDLNFSAINLSLQVEVTKRKRSLLLHKHTTWLPALMARGTE
jgi:hypothetical protein